MGRGDAGGLVTVEANEDATINASTRMLAKGSTSNDGGTSLVNNFANAFLDEYTFTTKSGTQTVQQYDKARLAGDYAGGTGAPGAVYQYTGTNLASLNLDSQDYADENGPWARLDSVNISPAFGNVSNSDSLAVGGLVVPQRRARRRRCVDRQRLDRGRCTERERRRERDHHGADACRRRGLWRQPLRLGHGDRRQRQRGDQPGAEPCRCVDRQQRHHDQFGGDIAVLAQNTSLIDATLLSSTTSGDTVIGVVLAFNSVGWEAQNLLLNALDALIGRPLDDFDHLITEVPSDGLDVGDRVKNTGHNKVYRYIGDAITGAVNLASQVYADATKWAEVVSPYGDEDPARVSATVFDSRLSFYELIDRNDVLSKVEARLQNVTVASSGDVSVQAIVGARISAVEDSTVSPWEGTGGVIATNNVLSSAKAHVDGGSITTTGHLSVDGFNQSLIEAQTRSTTLAFNSIGWQSQNLLFKFHQHQALGPGR